MWSRLRDWLITRVKKMAVVSKLRLRPEGNGVIG